MERLYFSKAELIKPSLKLHLPGKCYKHPWEMPRISGGAIGLHISGPIAHDGISTTNPISIGGVAETTSPAAVADGDIARFWVDEFGRLITIGGRRQITLVNIGNIGGNGTSSALNSENIKAFLARFSVTNAMGAGTPTPTLDMYIQTNLANGEWIDIVHFTQRTTAATKEILAYEGANQAPGTGGDVALTVDRFFPVENNALAATTVRTMPLGRELRASWVVAPGGGTGSYTFDIQLEPTYD